MAKHVLHQGLGEDDFLTHGCAACADPCIACFFFDATSGVGHVRTNRQADVAGQRPRRGGPSEDGRIIVGQFEFDVNGGLLHFFVAECHFVA